MYSKSRARCSYYLLLFCAGKLAEYCLSNGCGRLDGERVHKHGRGGRHDALLSAHMPSESSLAMRFYK